MHEERERPDWISAPDAEPLRVRMTTLPDGTRECTLFPSSPVEGRYTTAYIAAEEDAFVALEDAR